MSTEPEHGAQYPAYVMSLLIGRGPSKFKYQKYQKSQLDNYLSSRLMHVKRLYYYDLVKMKKSLD